MIEINYSSLCNYEKKENSNDDDDDFFDLIERLNISMISPTQTNFLCITMYNSHV